jgi:hypothetical protein
VISAGVNAQAIGNPLIPSSLSTFLLTDYTALDPPSPRRDPRPCSRECVNLGCALSDG